MFQRGWFLLMHGPYHFGKSLVEGTDGSFRVDNIQWMSETPCLDKGIAELIKEKYYERINSLFLIKNIAVLISYGW